MKKLSFVLIVALFATMISGFALAEGDKVEIRVNLQAGVGAAEGWAAVEAAYEELHPEADIIVDLKPEEGYADWVKAQFGSVNPEADLVAINLAGPSKTNKQINFFEYAYDESPYSDGVWTDQFQFEMQNRDMAKGEWDQVCLESVQVLWFYNKTIFEEVGVGAPTNWEEFVEVCEKLDEAGYQALALPGTFDSFWAMQMGWIFQMYVDQTTRDQIEIVKSQPGDWSYDEEIDATFVYDPTDPWNDDAKYVTPNQLRFWQAFRDGVIRADSDGIKKVTENFSQIFPKYAGDENFYGTDGDGALALFYQGKAAIFLDTGGRLTAFNRDQKQLKAGEQITNNDTVIENAAIFEMGTFNMPSMEGDEFLAPARTIEVAVGFIGAPKKSVEHDEAVVDFLMYFSSSEGYGKFLAAFIDAGGAIGGPPLVHGVELPDDIAGLFESLSFIGNCQKGYGQALARGIGDNQEALRAWYGYTMDYLNGKIDIDSWGEMHQENQMKYFPEVLTASKINPKDLDNPQNESTGE